MQSHFLVKDASLLRQSRRSGICVSDAWLLLIGARQPAQTCALQSGNKAGHLYGSKLVSDTHKDATHRAVSSHPRDFAERCGTRAEARDAHHWACRCCRPSKSGKHIPPGGIRFLAVPCLRAGRRIVAPASSFENGVNPFSDAPPRIMFLAHMRGMLPHEFSQRFQLERPKLLERRDRFF
jgi:hypothetical protein